MGVKGLWSLLNPVARPVQIESMEGKRLAIDSSIWLYQFQATMRDKDGRVLVNAHVLGFLRRINKLLFHGIKPVFVFDGGAPALKRATIAERKRKKAGAAANHAKVAEKLFAAQMRREAVKSAQASRDAQAARQQVVAMSRFPDDAGEQIAENAVYLEELEGRPGPSIPRPPVTTTSAARSEDVAISDPAEERRKKFRKHDPYRLPEATIPTSSTADKPDARLATEEELKHFIDEMHPSDIDIESAEFRALPTEVQYEIIGDMRIRSRQQSHKRLVDMLKTAPTALDFSKAQIKHLSQRNALTQQLLTVTDMVGSAHLTIPVRIAAERNREYVLVKRGEDAGGGWALGIREGTRANPIRLEPDDEKPQRSGSSSDLDNESEYSETMESDSDIEEVPPPPSTTATIDQDLRDHRRREILEAITARYAPKQPARAPLDLPVQPFGSAPAPGAAPLFTAGGEDDEGEDEEIVPTANDEALALALQQEELGSDEDVPDEELVRALALSRRDAASGNRGSPGSGSGSGSAGVLPAAGVEALSEGASVRVSEAEGHDSDESTEEMEEVELVPSGRTTPVSLSQPAVDEEEDEEDDFVEVVETVPQPIPATIQQQGVSLEPESAPETIPRSRDPRLEASRPGAPAAPPHDALLRPGRANPTSSRDHTPSRSSAAGDSSQPIVIDDDEDEEAEVVSVAPPQPLNGTVASPIATPIVIPEPRPPLLPHRPSVPSPLASRPTTPASGAVASGSPAPARATPLSPSPPSPPRPPLGLVEHEPERMIDEALASGSRSRSATGTPFSERRFTDDDDSAYRVPTDDDDEDEDEHEHEEEEQDEEEERLEWSRSPSPVHRRRPPLAAEISVDSVPSEVENEVEEDEGEMAPDDMVAEEDDYARFMAQIKNRDLNEVRTEIDDEIRVLNSANKVAMRDSDEITQVMIAQIQSLLRHFGIPYITAPMEAEAQCAKLAELGLVDGIITDDSDVFLFGGIQCFKNIFNDAKYAECFVLADIERELSLTRERLVSLAYLLGSDYTIGLPGVGPVVALELLANFPGPKGIDDFKNWWTRVQRGQDLPVEADTKWKKSFKKRYSSSIFLMTDWPNPLVREAYMYPTTDESKEPFHWGFPKLSALRAFLHEELSWSISKVDDELTPIVQRIARRGKVGALSVQATLDPFFDLSAGMGNYAPRRRTTANVSKRLLAVIKEFREAEARVSGKAGPAEWGTMMEGLDPEDPKGRGTGKRRRSSLKPDESFGTGTGTEDDDPTHGGESVKKKRVRRKKDEESVVGTETGTGTGTGTDGEVKDKPNRGKGRSRKGTPSSASASASGSVQASASGSRSEAGNGEGEGGEEGAIEGLRPVKGRAVVDKKERRAQQKHWRRVAVAGSIRKE